VSSLTCIGWLRLIDLLQEHGLITAEAVTLAQQLVNRQTTKSQLINDGFNRYSLNSKDGLPDWFLDEEAKFYKPNLPITKEAVAALRAKQRALDARPIKKIAEAKARKKFKAAQRLDKAMKKAEGVNATSDMSEREKAQQIEKVMRKGLSSGQKAKTEIKVVVAKGAHKGLKGRPKGVKGRYQMVDSRMKKEARLANLRLRHIYSYIFPGARQEEGRKGEQEAEAVIEYHSSHIVYSFIITPT
jgi:AdoMet-dependent rRNA methyltransferase SPB1